MECLGLELSYATGLRSEDAYFLIGRQFGPLKMPDLRLKLSKMLKMSGDPERLPLRI